MNKDLFDLAVSILSAMANARDELHESGAAAVLFAQKDAVLDFRAGKRVGTLFMPLFGVNQISRASSSDSNVFYNFPSIVSEKLWQMVRTGKASGPEGAIAEETTYRGGIVVKWGDFYVFIAFSGAKESVDVQISKAGAKALPAWKKWVARND